MGDLFSGSGVFGALGSVVNAATQEDINRQNIQFQRDTNAQNVALMREQWGREDNAVQRRAADLQRAGMNPLLAAGGAAQAGPAASLKAPQAGEAPQWGNVVTDALSARKQSADIAQTEANVALTQSQKAGQDAQNAWAYGTLDGRVQLINNQAEQSAALLATNIQLGLVGLDRAEAERDTAQIKNSFLVQDRVYEYGGYTFRQGPDNVMTGIWLPGLKYLETELQKRGVQQADLDIGAQQIQNEILQKSDNWFTADKIVGEASKVAGSIAEGISSAAFARKQFTSTR